MNGSFVSDELLGWVEDFEGILTVFLQRYTNVLIGFN